jgi:hypothetical protein
MKIEDKHIPTKTIKLSSKGKRVFPVDTKTLEKIKKKHSLSKKANTAGDPETRKQYNKIRNHVKSLTRKLRKSHEKDLSKKAKTNPKAIWSHIKSKTKTRTGIEDLHVDPKVTKSKKTDKGRTI